MVGRLERFIRDGRAIMNLEPEQIAERIWIGVGHDKLVSRAAAAYAIRADREAIRASLLDIIDGMSESIAANSGDADAIGNIARRFEIALIAFADRLGGSR
jgi:hypothetical protein